MQNKTRKPIRALLFTENAVPYRAALYRQLNDFPRVDLTVVVLDSSGLLELYDPEMGTAYRWDVPMFEGIHLIVTSPEFDKNDGKIHGVPGYNLPRSPLRVLQRYWRVFSRSFSFKAIKLLRTQKPDVVLLENYGTLACLILAIVSFVFHKPIILRSEAYHHPYRKKMIVLFKEIYLRLFYSLCSTVIYCCERSRAYFSATGCPERKLRLLPSAVDGPYFRARRAELSPHRKAIRDALGIPDPNTVVFISVGRLSRRKRNMELIRAFEAANMQNTRLIIVGDGPEKETLVAYCRTHKLDEVLFTGFRNQSKICDYYCAADAYVLFSDYDPSPKSVNEAMEFGLPVILSETIGNAPELCQDNGHLVNPLDLDKAAEALVHLATNASDRKRMGERSLQLAEDNAIEKNGITLTQLVLDLAQQSV